MMNFVTVKIVGGQGTRTKCVQRVGVWGVNMSKFKDIQIKQEDIAVHLSAQGCTNVARRRDGQYVYEVPAGYVPLHSCEAAIAYLAWLSHQYRGIDKKGLSRYDFDFGMSLLVVIYRYSRLTFGQLRAVLAQKAVDGKNGLLIKYRKQLEKAGFDFSTLISQLYSVEKTIDNL